MTKISIIGLGYVGLPLAAAFAEKYPIIGFDINPKRIEKDNRKISNEIPVIMDVKGIVPNPTWRL